MPKRKPKRKAGSPPAQVRAEGDPLKAFDHFLSKPPPPRNPKRARTTKASPSP